MRAGCEGETLKERLAHEPGGLDANEALRVADGLLAELAAAPAGGRIRRAVTTGTVFLCRDGSVRLIDSEPCEVSESDVYAAGIVLHEALTGQSPFAHGVLRIRPSVKRVLAHADEVLLKALADDPAERYPDVVAFRAALRQIRYREVRSSTDAYRLLRVVGEGGFGCVYRAWARGAGRYVAVKQLKRPEYGDRFRREAHVMRRLDDPAFVRLVDYFETKGLGMTGAFLVMDYLPGMPGSSLRDAIRGAAGEPLPFADVIRAFERYARALAHLHRLGIYHRDIKPSNLYYPSGDPAHAAIMDLGIARDVSGTATQGQVPGTLDYMPPEIVLGGSRGDAGMDIYALGLCLYEAVSGKTGYSRLPSGSQAFPTFYERVRAHVAPVFDAPVVRDRPMLLALLGEMTALDPAERLQDAELLRRRLMAVGAEVPGGEAATSVPIAAPASDASTGATSGGGERPLPSLSRAASGLRRLSPKYRRLVVIGCGVAAIFVLMAARVLILRSRARTNGTTVRVIDGRAAEENERMRRRTEVAAERTRRQEAVRQQRDLLSELAGTGETSAACEDRVRIWKERWRGIIETSDYVTLERDLSNALFARKNREAAALAQMRWNMKSSVDLAPSAQSNAPSRTVAPTQTFVSAQAALQTQAVVSVRTAVQTLPQETDERDRETKAILPSFPAGIVCLIDGLARKPGEILLPRGQHVVKFIRPEETYAGVKDYDPKESFFETSLAGSVRVPVPAGEWVPSAEFLKAREQAALVARGQSLEAECRRLLEPLPLETRRERLEKAHAILSDWKTPSALAALGSDAERGLRSAYDAEHARVRGYVRNLTPQPLVVTTDGGQVAVAAGETALVTFERTWPSDVRAVIAGYEFVMLPRDASAFDGRTFEVNSNRLVRVGAWEDPVERGKRSFFDSFRDAVDTNRRREIEDLERAIELRKKLEGKSGRDGR